jgi:hypothetical protein
LRSTIWSFSSYKNSVHALGQKFYGTHKVFVLRGPLIDFCLLRNIEEFIEDISLGILTSGETSDSGQVAEFHSDSRGKLPHILNLGLLDILGGRRAKAERGRVTWIFMFGQTNKFFVGLYREQHV